MIILSALLLGTASGLRSLTGPAVVAWAARLGALDVSGTMVGFLATGWVVWLLTALAVGELVADKLPVVPNRTDVGPLVGRLLAGAVCGMALGASHGQATAGVLAGCLGALTGTFGGFRLRARLATRLGADLPAALIEDVVAVGMAVVAVLIAV